MKKLTIILKLFPVILGAIKAIEEAIPLPGQGRKKLDLVLDVPQPQHVADALEQLERFRPGVPLVHPAAPDERLGHRSHVDRRHHARLHPEVQKGFLQRQAIDHGREHAHVVGGDAVHAVGGVRDAAKDVAAAHHDAHFNPEGVGFADLFGQIVGEGAVYSEGLGSEERFSGKLEENALVDGFFGRVPLVFTACFGCGLRSAWRLSFWGRFRFRHAPKATRLEQPVSRRRRGNVRSDERECSL